MSDAKRHSRIPFLLVCACILFGAVFFIGSRVGSGRRVQTSKKEDMGVLAAVFGDRWAPCFSVDAVDHDPLTLGEGEMSRYVLSISTTDWTTIKSHVPMEEVAIDDDFRQLHSFLYDELEKMGTDSGKFTSYYQLPPTRPRAWVFVEGEDTTTCRIYMSLSPVVVQGVQAGGGR